ncbi:Hypothetical predicted protein, partial [Olea europaea subsp. europaea]
ILSAYTKYNLAHNCNNIRRIALKNKGVPCSTGNQRSNGQMIEVMIIISEIPETAQSSFFRAYDKKTEV